MNTHIIKEEYAEFCGDTGSITGTAHYEVETASFFDRDCGGTDGQEVTSCELLFVQIDGLRLSRDQIAQVTCEAAVKRGEETVAENFTVHELEYAA